MDLHGLTAAAATAALDDFIAEARRRRLSCVRIVHGKGRRSGPAGPILKDVVRRRLAESEAVLAFAAADARHGGSGAVHVLLERG